jgi:hypothetical protein
VIFGCSIYLAGKNHCTSTRDNLTTLAKELAYHQPFASLFWEDDFIEWGNDLGSGRSVFLTERISEMPAALSFDHA